MSGPSPGAVARGRCDGAPPDGARCDGLDALATDLVDAWGCWGPTLTADGRQMAYVSDRSGCHRAVDPGQRGGSGRSGARAAPALPQHGSGPGGPLVPRRHLGGLWRGERRRGSFRGLGRAPRRLRRAPRRGGDGRHAVLGPWARRGHRLTVTVHEDADGRAGGTNRCMLLDPVDRDHRGPGGRARSCACWTSPRTSASSCAVTGPAGPNAAGCSTAPRGTKKTCCRSRRSAPRISASCGPPIRTPTPP